MKHALLVGVVALLLAAQDPTQDKGGIDKLQGSWRVVEAEFAGNKHDPEKAGMTNLVFKNDQMTIKKGDKAVVTFGIKVDPSKTPANMDWIKAGEPMPLPAIYELKDDQLRIAFPLVPKAGQNAKDVKIERPKNFETEGMPVGVLKARRENPK